MEKYLTEKLDITSYSMAKLKTGNKIKNFSKTNKVLEERKEARLQLIQIKIQINVNNRRRIQDTTLKIVEEKQKKKNRRKREDTRLRIPKLGKLKISIRYRRKKESNNIKNND